MRGTLNWNVSAVYQINSKAFKIEAFRHKHLRRILIENQSSLFENPNEVLRIVYGNPHSNSENGQSFNVRKVSQTLSIFAASQTSNFILTHSSRDLCSSQAVERRKSADCDVIIRHKAKISIYRRLWFLFMVRCINENVYAIHITCAVLWSRPTQSGDQSLEPNVSTRRTITWNYCADSFVEYSNEMTISRDRSANFVSTWVIIVPVLDVTREILAANAQSLRA